MSDRRVLIITGAGVSAESGIPIFRGKGGYATAMFGYIVEWAARAARGSGQLIEVNPEATSLSGLATECVRSSAGVAMPQLAEKILAASP
jgi:NAD-dependent SIR2 family protein deacetylase